MNSFAWLISDRKKKKIKKSIIKELTQNYGTVLYDVRFLFQDS